MAPDDVGGASNGSEMRENLSLGCASPFGDLKGPNH